MHDLNTSQFLESLGSCSIIYIFISMTGLISNVINIRTFIVMGFADGMTVSFFILSLAEFNFSLVAFVLGISGVLYIVEYRYGVWFVVDPYGMGVFTACTIVPLSATIALSTSYIAVARTLCVASPLYFKQYFSRYSTAVIMSCFFVASLLVCSPVFVFMGMPVTYNAARNMSRPSLWVSPSREFVKNIVWTALIVILPLVTQAVVVLSVVVMFHALQEASRFRNVCASVGGMKTPSVIAGKSKLGTSRYGGGLSKRDLQVVRQVAFISLAYVVCNSPKIVFNLTGVFEPDFSLGGPYNNLYLTISNVRIIFEMINCVINLPIYFKYNSKFRRTLVSR